MLAYVGSSRRCRQTLDYNEQKLTQGKAVLLAAFNYWEDMETLDINQKFQRLHERSLLNERVHKHTAHMSLNFHPRDNLTDGQMKIIAAHYLRDIGFADQPALVYRHLDAGHPHLHIVTTNIRHDGIRISNDLRSPRHLQEICRRLVDTHHLTPIGQTYTEDGQQHRQLHAHRLQYGKIATRTGIETVLTHILDKYAYTSVDRLNAVLSLYNVMADRGRPESHLYQNRGLYYRMLNDEGKKIGTPIKASAFDSRPTLDYLERRFAENQVLVQKEAPQLHIRSAIEWNLIKKEARTLEKLTDLLQKERIRIVIDPCVRRQTPARDGHAFYYVDFESRTVYRDTDLGEKYTALSLLQRMHLDETLQKLVQQQHLHLSNKKEAAILEDTDPCKKLHLWIKLAQQHDNWVKTIAKGENTLSHRLRHRHSILSGL